jgi:hypothetical protein
LYNKVNASTPRKRTRVFTAETAPDPTNIDPGPIGFIAIAFVAVAVVLLTIDMVRRIRRTRLRAEIAAKLDAELAAE